jgi:hypothetical protein
LPVVGPHFALAGPANNPAYTATNRTQLSPTNGVFVVTRLDGPTPALARGLVDKSIEAETNGLWGRAYFDARGLTNGDHLLGDNWIRASAQVCRRLGFETELDLKPETFSAGFPMSHIALYAGWYEAGVSGPFTRPTVEFMPGAVAYHLHSFNAYTIRSATEHWVGPLLAKGVTATFGSVDEPYLSGTPDLAIFFTRFIYLGFSFGEAFYAAQNSISWQNLAVGDPLFRPFSIRPDLLLPELEKRGSRLVDWYHVHFVNINLAQGAPLDDAVSYLDKQPVTRKSSVLLEKLADIYWAKKNLSDALDTYEQALKFECSSQQRARLLLTLASKRAFYGPDQIALNYYQQFLKEYPEWPDLLLTYQRLLPLAKKLDKKEVVEKCEAEIKRLTPPPPAPPASTPKP